VPHRDRVGQIRRLSKDSSTGSDGDATRGSSGGGGGVVSAHHSQGGALTVSTKRGVGITAGVRSPEDARVGEGTVSTKRGASSIRRLRNGGHHRPSSKERRYVHIW